VAPILNQPPQQPRITKQPARTSAVFPTLASHHPSSSNHPSALVTRDLLTIKNESLQVTTKTAHHASVIVASQDSFGLGKKPTKPFVRHALMFVAVVMN
jgi:hypothetical protein